jgi:hypothetical protein
MTETGRRSARRREYRCSFCNKEQDNVKQLIAGPHSVFICNECVDLCYGIVHEEEELINWSEEPEHKKEIRPPYWTPRVGHKKPV